MPRFLGHLRRRYCPRVPAVVLAALVLVGPPALAGAGEGPSRPGSLPPGEQQEPEDDAADPLRDARPTPVCSPGPVPDGRLARTTPPTRPVSARPPRPVPIDPSGTGRGLRLRC